MKTNNIIVELTRPNNSKNIVGIEVERYTVRGFINEFDGNYFVGYEMTVDGVLCFEQALICDPDDESTSMTKKNVDKIKERAVFRIKGLGVEASIVSQVFKNNEESRITIH